MEKVKMSPPWYGYANQIMALFGEDPDICISKDFKEGEDPILSLFVMNQRKAEAIEKLLPHEVDFGGVKLHIYVIPGNGIRDPKLAEIYRQAFEGNPVVKDIVVVSDVFTNPVAYVSFRKEVVQYYDDNLGDLHGNRSMLMQDIASEIFENCKEGILFCTDIE